MELPKEEATRLFDCASKLFEEEKYQDALDVLEQLYAYRKNSRRVNFARAECLYRLGSFELSMEICDDLISEHEYDPARKLRARLETRQIAAMQNQEPVTPNGPTRPATPTFASLQGMGININDDFDLPPTRIGPPPPMPGAGGAGGDTTALMEYTKIGGSVLFLGLVAGVLTLLMTSDQAILDVSPPIAFVFVFSQLIAYPVGLFVTVLAFNKLPKESWLENFSYIAVVCAMLGVVFTLTTFAYLFVPPIVAEFGGLICLNIVVTATLRFGFINLIVFLVVTGITRLVLAFLILGAQFSQFLGSG